MLFIVLAGLLSLLLVPLAFYVDRRNRRGSPGETLRAEVLVIPDCPHADQAVESLRAALATAGVDASVLVTVIDEPALAETLGFTGSPTFLLDGRDPFGAPGAPVAMACRVYPGGLPGHDAIVAAVEAAVRHSAARRARRP